MEWVIEPSTVDRAHLSNLSTAKSVYRGACVRAIELLKSGKPDEALKELEISLSACSEFGY